MDMNLCCCFQEADRLSRVDDTEIESSSNKAEAHENHTKMEEMSELQSTICFLMNSETCVLCFENLNKQSYSRINIFHQIENEDKTVKFV